MSSRYLVFFGGERFGARDDVFSYWIQELFGTPESPTSQGS